MSAWRDRFDVPEPAPLRVLRRRPGGYLRAATSAEDFERVSVRRSLSVGSLATYTESFRNSYLLNTRPNTAVRSDSVASYTHDGRQPVSSFDQLAVRATAAHLSDLGTEPPKPVMHASFEKEAQMLAQIPDDEDDGGIESALLKLEGKHEREKKPVLPAALESSSTIQTVGLRDDNCGNGNFATQAREKRNGGHVHILDEAARVTALSEVRVLAQQAEARTPTETRPVHRFKSFLSEGSHDSYYSTLLERGLSDASRIKTPTWEWTDRSILRGSEDDDSPIEHRRGPDSIEDDGRDISFDVIRRSKSIEGLQADRSTPSAVGIRSAENIGTDVTDLSSEHFPEKNVVPYTVDALFCEQEPMPAAVTGTDTGRGTKATHLSATIPDARPTTSGRGAQTRARRESVLPTPESSPATRQQQPLLTAGHAAGPSANAPHGTVKAGISPLRTYSVHLPFILAFSSDVLAQQLTLIEKDALNDIDWKELMDMKWRNATRSDSRSWVDFLRHSDAQGVEVVIARFNIMVKWVISEIVLTQQMEERAGCIIKLIHFASHCRHYRNFATLAQLTIALSSKEVTRLAKTWALVPLQDTETLSGLERLVTPMRNFHALRADMEMGSDAGCVPFVGIYTHDLVFNAQRPSEIVTSPTTAPLVNFERCRVGAAVVKTLLRLVEASARYPFVPVEGLTERCLWIGALSDDEIRCRSDGLE